MDISQLATDILNTATRQQIEYEKEKKRLKRLVQQNQLSEEDEAKQLAKIDQKMLGKGSTVVTHSKNEQNNQNSGQNDGQRLQDFELAHHPFVDSSVDTLLKNGSKDDVEFDYATGTYKQKDRQPIQTSVKKTIDSNVKAEKQQRDAKDKRLKEKIKSDDVQLTEDDLQKVRNDGNSRLDVATADVDKLSRNDQQQTLDYMKLISHDDSGKKLSLDVLTMQSIVQEFVTGNDIAMEAQTEDPEIAYLTNGVAMISSKDVGQINLDTELSTGALNVLNAHASDNVDPVEEKQTEDINSKHVQTEETDVEKETSSDITKDMDTPDMTPLDWQVMNAQLQPSDSQDADNIQLMLGFGSPDISKIKAEQSKLHHDHVNYAKLNKKIAKELGIAKKIAGKNASERSRQLKGAERVKNTPVRHVNLTKFNEIMKDNHLPELKVTTVKRLNKAKKYNLDHFLRSNPLYTKAVLYDSRGHDMTAEQLGFTHSDLADLETIRPVHAPKNQQRATESKIATPEPGGKVPQVTDDNKVVDKSSDDELSKEMGGPDH